MILFTIAGGAGAAGPPLISSLISYTHPDDNLWYPNDDPGFSWFSFGDPALAGTYNTPGLARDVAVAGDYSYVADYTSGLRIVNSSNPALPTSAGWLDTTGEAYGVAVSGNYAYVADGTAGLKIIEITNPAAPALRGSYDTAGTAMGITVVDNLAYIADQNAGLVIINVADPYSPTLAGTYDTPGIAYGVAVNGGYAYIADNGGIGLQIVDVSNPAAPIFVGGYDTPGYAYGVAAYANYVYVADGAAGLGVYYVSNPAAPELVGSYDTLGTAWDVSISGEYAFVADYARGLQVVDVTSPTSPSLKGGYDTTGFTYATAVSGHYVYLADQSAGLQIISMSANAGYSYLLDDQPLSTPDESVDVLQPTTSYSGVSDGVLYFHVRVKDNQGIWGPAAHRRVMIDDTAPAITGIGPAGTVATASAAVYGYLSDGASGVNTGTVSIEVDGQALDCSITETQFTCAATGLTEGHHTIDVAAADNAGNIATEQVGFDVAFCTAGRPALLPARVSSYWASYEDYVARLLSVDFRIENAGPAAIGTTVVGTVNSNSVNTTSPFPVVPGDINAGASADFIMVYQIPAGITTFKSTMYVTAANACSDHFSYPGPYAGT